MRQSQKLTGELPHLSGEGQPKGFFGYHLKKGGRTEPYFQPLFQQQEVREKWAVQFSEMIDTWDRPIRQALNQLAQILWPAKYVLRLIPISMYRLRDRQVGDVHVWWVERDIPPTTNISAPPTGSTWFWKMKICPLWRSKAELEHIRSPP